MKKVHGFIIAVLNFIFSFLFANSAVLAADVAPVPSLDPRRSNSGIVISFVIITVILLFVLFLIWKPKNKKNNDKNDSAN